MSRCHQTDALLDATFAGTDLTRAQADHAARCSECAHSLSQARRFEAELGRIGHDLSPEVMPSAADLSAATTTNGHRGRPVARRWALFGGAAAAALVVGVVASGQLPGAMPAGGIPPDDLDVWLDRAIVTALAEGGRGADRAREWEPVQVETCGDTAIAFYANPIHGNGGLYAWALGRPDDADHDQMLSGMATYLDDFGVAAHRANLPVCEVVRDGTDVTGDLAVGLGEVRRQMQAGDITRWREYRSRSDGEVEILDVGRLTPRTFIVLTEERTTGGFGVSIPVVTVEVDGFVQSPGTPGTFSPMYTVEGTHEADRVLPANRVLVDTHAPAVLFGRIDDPSVRAVDIVTADERLRYPVEQPGFAIRAHGTLEQRFELRNAGGHVIAAGRVDDLHGVLGGRIPPPPRASIELTCADWPGLTEHRQRDIADGLIEDRVAPRILESQHLPLSSTRDELVWAVWSSIDKSCQFPTSSGDALSDVFRSVYRIGD